MDYSTEVITQVDFKNPIRFNSLTRQKTIMIPLMIPISCFQFQSAVYHILNLSSFHCIRYHWVSFEFWADFCSTQHLFESILVSLSENLDWLDSIGKSFLKIDSQSHAVPENNYSLDFMARAELLFLIHVATHSRSWCQQKLILLCTAAFGSRLTLAMDELPPKILSKIQTLQSYEYIEVIEAAKN